MNETKATKDELAELKDEVLNSSSGKKEKNANLIFDGRQYSLRFPKKMIDEAQIDIKNDYFHIVLDIPDYSTGEKPKLNAKLMRKDDKEKTDI